MNALNLRTGWVTVRARARFDIERMVDGCIEVYRSLLGLPGDLA